MSWTKMLSDRLTKRVEAAVYRSFADKLEALERERAWLRDKIVFLERQNARQFFSTTTYVGHHTAWTWLTSNQRIFVDTRDLGIGMHLMARGYWEKSTNEVFRSLLEPTDTVVDVGAHYGYHTLTVAHLGVPKGRVVAVEANPRLYDLLTKSVRVNQLRSRVDVVHCAFSDREGEIVFVCPNDDPALGHVRAPDESLDDDGEAVTVPVRTLDSVCEGLDVDFIKIDVEGHESQVFRGGERTLARPKLKMLIEYAPAFIEKQQTQEEFHEQLRELGFLHVYEIKGTSLEATEYAALPTNRSLRNLVLTKSPL